VGPHRFVFIGTGLPGSSVEVRGSPHAVYLLDEGGKLLPLTPARIGATHVIWDPKDKALLYATNEGGDERFCRWCRIAWPPHAAEEPCRDVLTFRGFTGPLSFSPDGRRVAGARFREREQLLSTEDVEDSDRAVWVRGQVAHAWDAPSWSPRGDALVFVGDLSGDLNNFELFIVGADGTGLRQLTYLPVRLPWWERPFLSRREWDAGKERHRTRAPRWSPRGDWIAFVGDEGIYRVRPNGQDVQLIVAKADSPVWSPDGSHLAYAKCVRNAAKSSRGDSSRCRLYASLPDGTGEVPLGEEIADLELRNLIWLPD
jgi:Tol biopolymer transport system component